MTVDWRATLTALDAALAGASAIDAAIGAGVRTRLVRIGELYDLRYAPVPAPDTPTVQVESVAHASWTSTALAKITELDEIAAAADGEPPAVIDPDPGVALAAVRGRLEGALAVANAAHAQLVKDGLTLAVIDAEPRFFVDEYYEGGAGYSVRPFGVSYGAVFRDDGTKTTSRSVEGYEVYTVTPLSPLGTARTETLIATLAILSATTSYSASLETDGELELAMEAAINEATAWLAIA